jgi:hypothetical protein
MKKPVLTLFALSLFISTSNAKNDFTYLDVKNIPDSLKVNAHAVFRYDSTEVQVINDENIKYLKNYAITILDEKGLSYSKFVTSYNKSIEVDNMDAILLDANGKEIRSLKKRDILDISDYGGTVYNYNNDSRHKFYDFQHKTYPYTIVFKLEETLKSTFFLPTWEAPVSTSSSVIATTLSIQYPPDYSIRHKEYLMPEHFKKDSNKDNSAEAISWTLGSMPALKKQPCSIAGNFDCPTILLSPTSFKLYGHEGDLNTWQNMGLFFYKLNDGRDELPPEKIAEVKALVANETDTYAKIQKLYKYMQQNTRYVADEYAISGWQTFEAKDVARTGYGDCKGLVNYLKSLLKVADINAYTTLVFGGSDNFYKLDQSFPANNFNHVILCVPQPADSIWIECTSQQLPAGYLGDFTSNRDVLITTENGGYLTHTPSYDESRNFIIRKASMQFNPDNADGQTIHMSNIYSGPSQDKMSSYVKTMPEKDIVEMINKKFPFPSYVVEKYDYKHDINNRHIPSLIESAEANVKGIINSTQKRTFINMAWMRNPMTDLLQMDARTLPIVLNKSFVISDSIIVQLPNGTGIESMPSDKNVKLPFAEYELHFQYQNNQVILTRKYKQKEGIYDAKLYDQYQNLYQDIEKEKDKLSVVVLNKAS